MQPASYNERTGQVWMNFKGNTIGIIDSSARATWDSFVDGMNKSGMYTFKYQRSNEKILGDGVYSLIMSMPERIKSAQLPTAVALIVSSTINGHDVHEIYNYARHKMVKPGSGKPLLDFLRLFTWWSEGPQFGIFNGRLVPKSMANLYTDPKQSVVWAGIHAEDNPAAIEKLATIYESAGFYFPCWFSIKEHITPRGFRPGFGFYSGYSSAEIDEYLKSNFTKERYLTISKDVIHTYLGTPYTEDYGRILKVSHEEGGYLEDKYDGTLDILGAPVRGRDDDCRVDIPNPSNPSGKKIYAFHTHPFHCHRIVGLISGFPSIQDYIAHGSSVANHSVDGHIVLAREGAFIIQYHPYILFLIARGSLRLEELMNIEARFQEYLVMLDYEARRRGISNEIQQLSEAIKTRGLTQEEIRAIYDSDDAAIQRLVQDVTSFYFKPNLIMAVPFIFLQCIRRNAFADFTPPTFVTSSAIMMIPSSWGLNAPLEDVEMINDTVSTKKRGGYSKMQVTPDMLQNPTPMTTLERVRLSLAMKPMQGGGNNSIKESIRKIFQSPGVIRERRRKTRKSKK